MSPNPASLSQPDATGQTIAAPERIRPPRIDEALDKVQQRIAPVWPLQDYVAVNPYVGFTAKEFLATREYLRTLSDLELFMPVDYYRQQHSRGTLHRVEIAAAVDELVADGVEGAERIDVNQVVALLRQGSKPGPTADAEFTKAENSNRTLFTIAETIDRNTDSNWCRVISDEISKQCAAHYDEGQAAWTSASSDMPLFTAWRDEKRYDRTFEILGVTRFRKFVSELPHDAFSALTTLLHRLGLPGELWEDYLLCTALNLPGWSAWTQYQQRDARQEGQESDDFAGLMAIRLAYEVALSQHLDFHVDWSSVQFRHSENRRRATHPKDHDLLRYALLKASEIAFRSRLVNAVGRNVGEGGELLGHSEGNEEFNNRRLAQMVFCIDVRSERMRRHLEATTPEVETFGFAGFFGLPIEFVELGDNEGNANVPVLITPQFKVHEEVDSDESSTASVAKRRRTLRFLRKAWKEFQSSAVSTFAFVETTGLFYGFKLIARSIGWSQRAMPRFDGVRESDRSRLAPSLCGLREQGIDVEQQTDLAESVLRGIGIVDHFARLVVFCGHGSQVENNPLQAGLDCGACGGHSGEPNARLAAKLLNQEHVRQGLAERGILIPDDTHFVAATHNTTTDKIEFFDEHLLPHSHQGDLEELELLSSVASKGTRKERLRMLPGESVSDLDRRSADWSEVRPEWGLAGNAAFIAAPRAITESVSLDGRSFLHSYDYRRDPNFAVLEQIMTAPMVVAHWINMQYYASTVDPIHFGSGNKTVHNVVGHFGVVSGNGGDLKTGLPWQSVHDGIRYQHHPLRLLVLLAAPRSAIKSILSKHPDVADLVANGWLHLLALEEGQLYRHTEQQTWEEICDTLAM